MKFHFYDLFWAGIVSVLLISGSLYAACLARFLSFVPEAYFAFCQIFLFLFTFFLLSILLLWLIRLFFPQKDGTYILDQQRMAVVWKLQGFLYVFNLGLFINSQLIPVNMRALVFSMLGARIGRNVMIGGKILEPTMIEIGDYTILGEDSLLTAHAKAGGRVDLGRIKIGKGVTIGVKAVVMPGVEIEDNAIVGAGSVVTKGTRIPGGEIWAGIPARKIGTAANGNA
jgi:acetyltransferase-like isoleucine patch superfamily enzyme